MFATMLIMETYTAATPKSAGSNNRATIGVVKSPIAAAIVFPVISVATCPKNSECLESDLAVRATVLLDFPKSVFMFRFFAAVPLRPYVIGADGTELTRRAAYPETPQKTHRFGLVHDYASTKRIDTLLENEQSQNNAWWSRRPSLCILGRVVWKILTLIRTQFFIHRNNSNELAAESWHSS